MGALLYFYDPLCSYVYAKFQALCSNNFHPSHEATGKCSIVVSNIII